MFSSLFSSNCRELESGESLIPSLIASPAVQKIYIKKINSLKFSRGKKPILKACMNNIERLECKTFDTLDSPGFCSLGELPAVAWVKLMHCVNKQKVFIPELREL